MSSLSRSACFLLIASWGMSLYARGHEGAHTQQALQALQQAAKQADSGDTPGTVEELKAAKEHTILHETQHPFHEKGDNPSRRRHAQQSMAALNQAKVSANAGNLAATRKAIRQAQQTLRQEQRHHR